VKVRRYTKEELDAIDAAVMKKLKAMVENPKKDSDDEAAPPVVAVTAPSAVAKPAQLQISDKIDS
jgi:hypothetical protein